MTYFHPKVQDSLLNFLPKTLTNADTDTNVIADAKADAMVTAIALPVLCTE